MSSNQGGKTGGLEDLIPVVNKLQNLVFNTIGSDTIDLPQVVVVGSQSSGKSSVLENIVGRDFLPRGIGIVTRRPLVLQLINTPASTDDNHSEDVAEFLHLPGRRFTDFAQIRTEIEQETTRIAGLNKGISRNPIHLKIFSAAVVNLTLIDLPGLTKIPIGDQPGDIERQVLTLIREYIAKPNSIILAVSPANVDLVNSEGLKLARQVDPTGKRTIGVLTKLDLMDHGTNAIDILSGRVYPLKLGFIGCVNRSQQDITVGKSLSDSLVSEEEFFASHPAYRNLRNRCGTKILAKTLNQILLQHIREKLPDIKARINALIGQTQQELSSYGGPMIGQAHRGSTILQAITKFASNFVASIDGTKPDIPLRELCGGARIYQIFNAILATTLSQLDPMQNLSTTDIRIAIRNSTGPRASLFVPELAFELLVKPQIQLLEAPSVRCVELVYEELMKICHTCGDSDLTRYPKLQMRLIEVVSDLLRERLSPTTNYVESLIAIQKAYVNTNHPDFLGGAGAMTSVLDDKHERDISTQLLDDKSMRRTNGHRRKLSTTLENFDPAEPVARVSSPVATQRVKAEHSSVHNKESNGHIDYNEATKPTSATKDGFLTYFFGTKDVLESQTNTMLVDGPARLQGDQTAPHLDSVTKQMDSMLSDLNRISDKPLLTEREHMETQLIRNLIKSYFGIVRETTADQVPKAIMYLLVNYVKQNIQHRLVAELYKEESFDHLLYEDETIAQEREKCSKLLGVYSEANRIIQEVL